MRRRVALACTVAGLALALAGCARLASIGGTGASATGIEDGKRLFLSRGCDRCHTLDRLAESAWPAGPDLTHVASADDVAGVLRPVNGETLSTWLRDPRSVKHGVIMPNYHLSESDVSDLAAYFMTLK